ncbi:MAG: DHH family phosphoesterase [Oscillospiraceae bacterium]|nr:DHH family phosphoesterase [Oscillospiraceae bacterium]
MKDKKYIITSYTSPDIDGVSAMYAYSELLNKLGKTSHYYIDGEPIKEVQIVCNKYMIELNSISEIDDSNIIIVDTNSPDAISRNIRSESVVEIIDHHVESDDIYVFSNAKKHIETIGAVATIIAEKFKSDNVSISRESAILLYYGIVSNTINFKNKVTTVRDIEMAKWLKEQCEEIKDIDVKEVFIEKSKIDDLRSGIIAEIKIPFSNKSLAISQLELVDVKEFIDKNIKDIKQVLGEVKKEKKLEYIFLNCIDIFNGYNMIISESKGTAELLEDVLNIESNNGTIVTNQIMMRKEIVSLMKEKWEGIKK